MCKLKSAIVLKDRIFMPDYDSHSKMLEELGINDDYLGASKKFVRVELSPPSGDVFSDIDTWFLIVDQDIRPDWFLEEECKQKMIDAVKGWAKDHIHIGVKGLKISTGENHYIKDCQDVEVCGSASISYVYGSTSISKVCGSAMVASSPYLRWQKWDALIVSENATLKDNYGKVVYQAGGFKLISVESGKTIGERKEQK